MPPALLAGHCSLCVPSSKPLEVQSTVSAQLGSQEIFTQRDGIGREQEMGDLGSNPAVNHWLDTGCLWPCSPGYKMSKKLTYSYLP